MNRCNDTHAVLWDGKYAVAENDGLAALPGIGEDRRATVPAATDLYGSPAWTEPAPPTHRNGRQEVIVAGRTIAHARHSEATMTTCGDEIWSVGAGTCQRHHHDRTDETGACYAVLCFRRRALLVVRGKLVIGHTQAAAPITAATASHGAVLSGNDVFVANASCITGVFSALSACAGRPWRTRMLASDGSGVYVLDGPTGDVLVFRHHEPPPRALLALLATVPRPSAAPLTVPPPAATTRNRPPVMLPPTIAAERLALGKASALAVVDGHVRRTFDDVVVVSPVPRASASSVHGEYVPRALCTTPPQECPWHQYNKSGACATRSWPVCRARIVATSDTTCAHTEPTPAYGHNVCVPAPACPSGHARTHLGAVTDRCCPAPECAGTYNYRDEVCHPPPARSRRATPAPPTCPPLPAPTEAPNAPPSRGTPCQDGEYGPRCAPCGVCRAGQRLLAPCTATTAVLCGDCPAGTWMDLHAHTLRHCKQGNGCPGVTTTHDGVCDLSHTSLARWWWTVIPVYGVAVQIALERR